MVLNHKFIRLQQFWWLQSIGRHGRGERFEDHHMCF